MLFRLATAANSSVLALVGQISAASPMLLSSILLAQLSSGAEFANFVFVSGASSVAFIMSNWGLRQFLSTAVDGAKVASDAVILRVISSAVMAVFVILSCSLMSKIEGAIIVVAVALRVSDSFADVRLGYLQATESAGTTITAYSTETVVRFVLWAAVAGVLLWIGVEVVASLLYASTVALGLALAQVMWRLPYGSNAHIRKSMRRILARAFHFAGGGVACAILVASPRLLLFVWDAQDAVTVGAVMSLSTLYGMIFQVIWVQALPAMKWHWRNRRCVNVFWFYGLRNVSVIFLLGLLVPQFSVAVQALFGLEKGSSYAVEWALLCMLVFFGSVNYANILKIIEREGLEAAVYISAAIAFAVTVLCIEGLLGLYVGLLISSVIIIVSTIFAVSSGVHVRAFRSERDLE